MSNRFVVIMAGGRGERFWPLSRLSRPKHLLPIVGDSPMLTQTVDRLAGLVPAQNILVITNREQVAAVTEAVPSLPRENVIAEPVGRDTAAAVGLAAVLVKQRDPEAVFAMLPADHVIHDRAGFQRILERAFLLAERRDVLVTIGIQPTEPATGYGYLQRGEILENIGDRPAYAVRRFVEKPDLATAETYLASGDFLWNAGMFVWRVGVIEAALRRHTPDLAKGLRGMENDLAAGRPLDDVLEAAYAGLQKISIDYAVMEKADNVATVESAFDWDDVGSWPASARHFPADDRGNVVRGDAVMENAGNNIVIGQKGKLIAALGVEDLIIVQTGDATLVCRRDQAQNIKSLVKRLEGQSEWKHLL